MLGFLILIHSLILTYNSVTWFIHYYSWLRHLVCSQKISLPGKGVLPESWVQIHGRKCTYTTPQPLVSAYFPCDKQRAEKQTQESMLQSVNFNNAAQNMAVIQTGYTDSIFFDTTFNPPRDASFFLLQLSPSVLLRKHDFLCLMTIYCVRCVCL